MNTIFDKVTDNTVMWFGKFAGRKLKNIPAKYLIAISEYSNLPNALKKYLKENMELLTREQYKSA